MLQAELCQETVSPEQAKSCVQDSDSSPQNPMTKNFFGKRVLFMECVAECQKKPNEERHYYFDMPVVNSSPPYVCVQNDHIVSSDSGDPLVLVVTGTRIFRSDHAEVEQKVIRRQTYKVISVAKYRPTGFST